LDIDALRIVAEGVNAQLNPELGVLVITHYQRLLDYIRPDVVHVLAQGRIIKTGGRELALELERDGYAPVLREAGLAGTGDDGAAAEEGALPGRPSREASPADRRGAPGDRHAPRPHRSAGRLPAVPA